MEEGNEKRLFAPWTDPEKIANRAAKARIGEAISARVRDGEVIGIGSGSTALLALLAIAERQRRDRLAILAVPTSLEIAFACARLGIAVTSLSAHRPQWCFDGTDEVDSAGNLIKGRGGAFFREKLVMRASGRAVILAERSKQVERLGSRFPIPVEVYPEAALLVEERLRALGANAVVLRAAGGKDGPVVTEQGNLILDASFDGVEGDLETRIESTTGVLACGLFWGYGPEIVMD
jgi:ribose 5-phosphate isomerase A